MAFPKNITKEHLLKAIEKIDTDGIPSDGNSKYYDVIYNGKKYPPKVIISYANIFANGEELDRNSFGGGIDTKAFKLLNKEGFTIEEKIKLKNIRLYDIHGDSAIENYKSLITNDSKYFYWDSNKFKKYKVGDIIYWVNRSANEALFTVIDSIEITPKLRNGRGYIEDLGYTTSYTDTPDADNPDKNQFDTFYRFKVIEKKSIASDWAYSNPVPFGGQTMSIILLEPKVDEPHKKIEKIQDLMNLFKEGDSYNRLEEAKDWLLENAFKDINTKMESNERKVWFVCQGLTYKEEKGKKYLWAPQKDKAGNKKYFWDNMLKVKTGDIIFNYSDGLKAVSLAMSDGYIDENPDTISEWGKEGYRVDIDINELSRSISYKELRNQKDLFNKLLNNGESPFDSNGDVKQGYLFGFTKEAGRLVRDIYGSLFGNNEIDDFFDKVKITSTPNTESMNMNYDEDYRKEIIAIKTKPFVLLAGISGTGKSRIVRTLAYKTCSAKELQNDQPGNFLLIKVKPNWHDSSELIGYVSRINSDRYVIQEFLRFLVKAWKFEEIPFLLCLDEMNLAPVEQYLAEYLSIVETRKDKEGKIITDAFVSKESVGNNTAVFEQLLSELGIEKESELWNQFFEKGITLPPNLILIGTVNMDETTHSFSRKVLDRAMTIEMNDINLFGGLEETNFD